MFWKNKDLVRSFYSGHLYADEEELLHFLEKEKE